MYKEAEKRERVTDREGLKDREEVSQIRETDIIG